MYNGNIDTNPTLPVFSLFDCPCYGHARSCVVRLPTERHYRTRVVAYAHALQTRQRRTLVRHYGSRRTTYCHVHIAVCGHLLVYWRFTVQPCLALYFDVWQCAFMIALQCLLRYRAMEICCNPIAQTRYYQIYPISHYPDSEQVYRCITKITFRASKKTTVTCHAPICNRNTDVRMHICKPIRPV